MAPSTETVGAVEPIAVERVIFAAKAPSGSGFTVYSLVEQQPEAPETPGAGFKLTAAHHGSLPDDVLLLSGLPAHLDRRATSGADVHVVVSTKSGTGLARSFYDAVFRPLFAAAVALSAAVPGGVGGAEGGDEAYELTLTESAETIRRFAQERLGTSGDAQASASRRAQTVILLSGDGGVVDLLNGYEEKGVAGHDRPPRPTIAILPLGTGNALFHSINKPHYTQPDPSSKTPAPSPLVIALRTIFKGKPAPLPTFEASFSPGARLITYIGPPPETGEEDAAAAAAVVAQTEEHQTAVSSLHGAIVASYGFHAQLVWESDTPEYRRHGAKRFGMVAQELLRGSHAYDAVVEVVVPSGSRRPVLLSPGVSAAADDGTSPGARSRFSYVLATMVSNLEKAFTISPASRPLDGKLRLVHFGDVGSEKTMEIMMAAYDGGKHVGMAWTAGPSGPGQEEGEEAAVGYNEVEEVRVTINEEDARWRKVCIDGTIVEIVRGGWMAVKRSHEFRFDVLVVGLAENTSRGT